MATTYTVKKGDTLSQIALDQLGSASKYKQLAAINDISNPNLIYVGQVLKLTNDGSSSNKKNTNSNKAIIKHFGLQSNSNNTLFATWTWDKSYTENYEVQWYYATGDGVWFVGSDGTTEYKQSTYNIPSNATKVKIKVKPIAKKQTVNGKEKERWKANWSNEKIYVVKDGPPETPDGLSVDIIEKNKLTASIDNIDSNATQIQFQIVKNNKSVFKTITANITKAYASCQCTVDAGGEYKVRCRAVKKKLYSNWSEYSNSVASYPSAPSKIETLKTLSSTSVYISWSKVSTAERYTIQYTEKKSYFDSSPNNVSSTTVESTVIHSEITGLESGKEYFFRVRATNKKGDSGWTAIKSVVVGKKPSAPTTWSSTTTAIVGEGLYLYWAHNSEDGSKQTYAKIELSAERVPTSGVSDTSMLRNSVIGSTYVDTNGNAYTVKDSMVSEGTVTPWIGEPYCDISTEVTLKFDIPENTEEVEKTPAMFINTNAFSEGIKLKWRVKTKGIHADYSDWSILRTIDIYSKPTFDLTVTDVNGDMLETLTSFPFYIEGIPGPNTQAPIGYHIEITANEGYKTVDNVGNKKIVSAGDSVYSNYFDISNTSLVLELSAGHLDLENGISYTIDGIVSMNSGLTAKDSAEFTVSWTDEKYVLNARIGINPEDLTASINPYCESRSLTYYKVILDSDVYTRTEETVDGVYGEILFDAVTTTGEQVFAGTTADDEEIYYCEVEDVSTVENVTLSVYRREYDGTFTEIATGIQNGTTFVPDPHPALDYARYRIVAIDNTTGAVSYYDMPGEPVGETSVIIQWAEDWTSFNTLNEDELEDPEWTGSMLKLPYNIDVSDKNNPDVELVEYIGRKYPVAYYGTQLGETSTWSVEIPKDDKETLYALRRLRNWMGDVYVREPSGSGYWANINVTFSQKHRELTIPITLDISRVEGGM